MTGGDDLRSKLFELYARNLALFSSDGVEVTLGGTGEKGNLSDFYVCPLCMQAFHKTTLSLPPEDNPLSIEHVPPERSSHGKDRLKVLTCKTCNSEAGRKLDSHLASFLRLSAFFSSQSNSPMRCRLNTEGFEVGADWTIPRHGTMKLAIADRVTSPVGKEGFVDALRKKLTDGISFSTQFLAPDARLAKLAILKSAYLALFGRFGYSYPQFAKAASGIRDQLRNPSADLFPVALVQRADWMKSQITAPSISIMREPEWLRSILILLRLGKGQSGHLWSVFLPGPDETVEDLHSRASSHNGEQIETWNGTLIDPLPEDRSSVLTQPQHRHLIHVAWHGIAGNRRE